MGTTSVATYKWIIDKEVKQMACSFRWCSIKKMFSPSEAGKLLTLIQSAPENNITTLLKQNIVHHKLLNVYLIYALSRLTSYYIEESQLTFLGFRRSHTELIKQIHEQALHAQTKLSIFTDWHFYTPIPIKILINLLQDGVLRSAYNPNGNFANMCRAVVIQTRGMPEWDFNPRFLIILGLHLHLPESLVTSPSLTQYTTAKRSSGSMETVRIIHPSSEYVPPIFNDQKHGLKQGEQRLLPVLHKTEFTARSLAPFSQSMRPRDNTRVNKKYPMVLAMRERPASSVLAQPDRDQSRDSAKEANLVPSSTIDIPHYIYPELQLTERKPSFFVHNKPRTLRSSSSSESETEELTDFKRLPPYKVPKLKSE